MSQFYMGPLCSETVSNVTATNSVNLGTRRWDGKNEYVYCCNAGNSAIAPGYGCIVTAITGYSVTLTSVTQVSPAFCVVENATVATGNYFWGLVRGFQKLEVHANSVISTGDNLVLGANGVWSEHAVSTGFVGAVGCAHALATTASGGSVLAHVFCHG